MPELPYSSLYTNNKIEVPKDKPAALDVLALSVGTDPGWRSRRERERATTRFRH